jgi:hypothetical protein
MANGYWAILTNEAQDELSIMSFITRPADENGVKTIYKFKLPRKERLNWAAMKIDT